MATDTNQTWSVEIDMATARALWAAMHNDDQLANDYVNLACIHALNHLVKDLDPGLWSGHVRAILIANLMEARRRQQLNEEDMAKRFHSYDVPF